MVTRSAQRRNDAAVQINDKDNATAACRAVGNIGADADVETLAGRLSPLFRDQRSGKGHAAASKATHDPSHPVSTPKLFSPDNDKQVCSLVSKKIWPSFAGQNLLFVNDAAEMVPGT